MATTTSPAKVAAAKPVAKSEGVAVSAPSRREFLYYIWGASIALTGGLLGAATVWFAYPRFKEGEFGGTFTVNPAEVPAVGAAPVFKPEGRFWLSNPQEGFLALYGVCTHLGCLPKWSEENGRFECPCHGSRYELNGKYITGPAPRSLDRFAVTLTFADGSTATTDSEGNPIPLNGRTIQSIRVDTSARIKRNGKV